MRTSRQRHHHHVNISLTSRHHKTITFIAQPFPPSTLPRTSFSTSKNHKNNNRNNRNNNNATTTITTTWLTVAISLMVSFSTSSPFWRTCANISTVAVPSSCQSHILGHHCHILHTHLTSSPALEQLFTSITTSNGCN